MVALLNDALGFLGSDRVFEIVCVVAAAATVLSAAAVIASTFFFRRDPALRHAVLLSALLCALATPFLATAFVTSGVSLARVPVLAVSKAAPELEPVPRELATSSMPSAASSQLAGPVTPEVESSQPTASSTDTTRNPSTAGGTPVALERSTAPLQRRSASTATRPVERHDMFIAALLVWLCGGVFLLARLLRDAWRLNQVRRTWSPLVDPVLLELLESARRIVGCRRRPRLSQSDRIRSPVVAGLLHPTIVLPTGLDAYSRDEILDVLVHEMAHVARFDTRFVLLERVARCIFWPIPPVHLAVREIDTAREEICDNHVLRVRTALTYSETLFHVAERSLGVPPLAAAGMLRARGKLEARVARLIDPRRKAITATGALKRFFVSLTIAAVAILACGTSLLVAQTESFASIDTPVPAPPMEPTRDATPPRDEPDARMSLVGKVEDPDGKPVGGAVVRAVLPFLGGAGPATSKKDGSFTLEGFSEPDLANAVARSPRMEAKLVATAPGYVFDFHLVPLEELFRGDLEFRLAYDVAVTGRILNADGRPLGDISVAVKSIGKPKEDLDALLTLHRAGREISAELGDVWYGVGEASSPVRTDAGGRFRLQGLGGERIVSLSIDDGRNEASTIVVLTRAPPEASAVVANGSHLLASPDYYFADFEHRLPRAPESIEDDSRRPHSNGAVLARDLEELLLVFHRLLGIEDDERFLREAYRTLLEREPTAEELKDFLAGTDRSVETRNRLLFELASNRKGDTETPVRILDELREKWDLGSIDSELILARFTRRAERRTRGEIVPSLLIYANGAVVLPARLPNNATTHSLAAKELAGLLRTIADDEHFFEIDPNRLLEDRTLLNEGVEEDDLLVNDWTSGWLWLWVSSADGWHSVRSHLDSWIHRVDKARWPDEIQRLYAIDERLKELMMAARR